MLIFDKGNARFNFRSVAVIVNDDHVLLHRAVGDSFWTLPGGRVEFFENTDATLNRELLEELGIESTVKRHLWYVENFFEYSNKSFMKLLITFSFNSMNLIDCQRTIFSVVLSKT
ncbi:NUDIX hydrolase [Photobacterium alginatilyticum]|uniref:NUDIX hydrolase n=1 Tax=Photobacterium alginatilyticum TaxID=1775171 RepID=UPI001F035C1B|nr:NUDIX domain-containing protein [Photobacterium alginatilyticum]